jgi:hypothetical protein
MLAFFAVLRAAHTVAMYAIAYDETVAKYKRKEQLGYFDTKGWHFQLYVENFYKHVKENARFPVLAKIKELLIQAHWNGTYNIACDEEFCAHENIKLGRVKKLCWHAQLYCEGFALDLWRAASRKLPKLGLIKAKALLMVNRLKPGKAR